MKKLLLLPVFLFAVQAFAQKNSYTPGYDEKTDESKKLLYNYTYGSYYFGGAGINILSFNSVSYFANGRQQFGLGAGVSTQNINSDSGKIQFVSVPVFLANKFYLVQNPTNGGLYLDIRAGFNLPVSAIYQSGEKSGKPVDPANIRSTGFYGASIGWRFTAKKQFREINYIVELCYLKQILSFEPDTKKHPSDFFGLSLGLSF